MKQSDRDLIVETPRSGSIIADLFGTLCLVIMMLAILFLF